MEIFLEQISSNSGGEELDRRRSLSSHISESLDIVDWNLFDIKSTMQKKVIASHTSTIKSYDHEHQKFTSTRQNPKYNCLDCKVPLTSEEYLRRHLKSKSHRKNVRRLESTSSHTEDKPKVRGKFRLFSLSEVGSQVGSEGGVDHADQHEAEEGFNRQKYRTRSDSAAFKLLESYIYSIVSYLSLKLALDPNTTDFKISVNDKRWQIYGDIVINLIYKDKLTIYAIRCKQISNTSQSIDSLKDVKINLEKEYDSIRCLINQKDFAITKFLIFTTSNTSSRFCNTVDINADVLSKWKKNKDEVTADTVIKVHLVSKKNDILNVSSENDNVFLISYFELPPVFLYTSQRIFPHMIDELIKKNFGVNRSFFKEYKDYIETWGDGELGGNYCLTKKDVILKVGELLLQPYIILPKMINFKTGNFEVWNRVVENTDVIIIKSEPFVLSKLCEPFNRMIEESLSVETEENVKIDSITKTVTVSDQVVDKLTDPQIKAYLFEERDFTPGSEIHLTKLYNVFWKAGKIPLLISLENNEDSKDLILEVISFMKTQGVHKKFMLKTETPFLFRSFPDNLKVFSSLNDVKELVDLDDIRIRIARDFSLSLQEISKSDPFFLKWVSPSIFFDMVLERYTMRKDETSKMNIQTELKIILDDETREKVRSTLYEDESLPESLGRLAGVDPTLF